MNPARFKLIVKLFGIKRYACYYRRGGSLGKEEKGILVRYPGKPCLRSSHHGGIKNLGETLRVTLVSANFSTEGLTKNSPAEMQIPFTRR